MSTPERNVGGRPTIYNEDLADFICNKISTTTLGTNKLCAMFDEFPDESTIYAWRIKHESFSKKYANAKSKQAEILAEKLIEMSDEVEVYEDEKGVNRIDPGMLGRQRLKIDTLKWYASKLAPKIYGEKQQTDVTVKHETDLNSLA